QEIGRIEQSASIGPARADAAVLAVEIGDATRLRDLALRGNGRGEVAQVVPLADVAKHAQAVFGVDGQFVDEPAVQIIQAATGVEVLRRLHRLPAVFTHLRRSQPEWVLIVRLIEIVQDQRGPCAVVEVDVELAVELVLARGAVLPIAVGLEARRATDVIEIAAGAAEFQAAFPGAPAAAQQAAREGRIWWAILREDLDHTSGMVPIERRKRPAQDLDALSRRQIEQSWTALTVRGAGRNAVGKQLDPTRAELRACTETADDDLLLLRVAVAVLHHRSGHAIELLGNVDLWFAGLLNLRLVDAVNGHRQIEAALLDARGGHYDR